MLKETVFYNRWFEASIKGRDFFLQDGYIECRNKSGEILFTSNEKGGEYILECTDLFVHGSKVIKVFNNNTGEFKRQIPGYTLFRNSYIDNCCVLVDDYRENLPGWLSRLNLKTNVPEWTVNFTRGAKYLISNDTIYLEKYLDKKNLYAIDLKNGNILWQYDISQVGSFLDYAKKEEPYSLVQVVGVIENLLWVLITGGKLLALDTQTGHLIHQLDFNQIFEKEYHATSKMLLDKEQNRIIWLPNALIHIDLVSLKCTVVKEFSQGVEKKDKWYFRDRLLHNNKIFFTGDLGMYNLVVPTFIGIMDVNTGEILWNTQLLKCDGIRIGGLNVSRNKIYARDGKGSLHVFEQELDF